MIRMVNISKSYVGGDGNKLEILKELTVTINKGEFVAIMAPSGTGKSTLMHIMGCLNRPSGGVYLLDGEEAALLSDSRLARIRNEKVGFIFQGFHLLPRLTAYENVTLPLLYNHSTPGNGLKALGAVSMLERASHYPGQMSGGEQQRVAIARALINNPSLILADEPTGNLDEDNSNEVMKIFKGLHNEGRTIVLVTHDREIARIAERILWLIDGKLTGGDN